MRRGHFGRTVASRGRELARERLAARSGFIVPERYRPIRRCQGARQDKGGGVCCAGAGIYGNAVVTVAREGLRARGRGGARAALVRARPREARLPRELAVKGFGARRVRLRSSRSRTNPPRLPPALTARRGTDTPQAEPEPPVCPCPSPPARRPGTEPPVPPP